MQQICWNCLLHIFQYAFQYVFLTQVQRTFCRWVHNICHSCMGQQCAIAVKRTNAKPSGGVLPAHWGRWSFPSAWHFHTWSAGSLSKILNKRETWVYWREYIKGPLRGLRGWSIYPRTKGRQSGGLSAWRLLAGILLKYKPLKGGYKENGVMLFSAVCNDRTEGNGLRLKHNFSSNIRKLIFFCS